MSGVGGITGSNGTNGTFDVSAPLSAANALTVLRRHLATSVTISDSTQNILRNLDALQAVAGKITALTTTDSNQNIVVTGAQYQKDGAALAVWGATAGQTVSVTAAKATFTTTPPSYVTSVSVSDSRGAIQNNLDHLQTLASSGLLHEIVQGGAAGYLSLTTAQLSADQGALSKFKNGAYSLAITNATVSDVLGLGSDPALATNSKVKSIAIVDTTDAIASHLDELQRVGLRIAKITQTDPTTHISISGQQYTQDKLVLGKIITSDLLDVMDASAAQSRALVSDAHVVTVDIQDNAAAIAKNWSLLQSLSDLTSVTVTDQSNPIRLTAAQLAGSDTLLGKFVDTPDQTYNLVVTGVASGEATTTAAVHNVSSVEVTDTSANIAASLDDLEALDSAGKLGAVTLQGTRTPITLDASRLQGAALTATQSVLDKITGGNYVLSVTGATTSALADLASNRHVTSIAVSDTAAHIAAALDTMGQLGSRIRTIEQTDSGTVFDVTQAQLDARGTTLAKIQGGYTVNVSGVTALKATSDARNVHVAGIAVADTARAIAANWTALRGLGTSLDSIAKTDGNAITLATADYRLGVHDDLVSKFAAGTTFTLNNASVADAQAVAGDQAVTQIDVTDDTASILGNLTALETLAGGTKLHSIVNATPTSSLSLTAAQLQDAQPVLDLIKGASYSLALTDVGAADAKALLSSNHKIASMAVTGDAATIVANLADLKGLGNKLATITQTDAATAKLQMTGADFQQNGTALAKIQGGFLADLTDVSAASAAALAGNTSVSTLSVSDNGANLANAWGSLVQVGSKLTSVTQTDSATLQLGMTDWSNGQASLRGKFASDPTVSISGVAVSEVDDLASDSAVQAMQVTDTSDAVSAALDSLAAESKLTQIQLADPSVALTMTSADYTGASALLALVKNGNYTATLSDVTAADAATLANDTHVASMDVVDSASEVASNFDALAAAGNLGSITLSDDNGTISLTGAQLLANGSTLDTITGTYQLAATDVAMTNLADVQSIPEVSTIAISDSADNVSANFGDLLALGDSLAQVHLTDASPVLALSADDFTAGASALGTVDGSYQVDVSAASAGDAQALAADSSVRKLEVADTASNIAGQWDTLVGLYDAGNGKLTGLSLTDANSLVLTTDQQTAGAAMIAALLPDETIETP